MPENILNDRVLRWLAKRQPMFYRRLFRTTRILRMQLPRSISQGLQLQSTWVLLNGQGELWSADGQMLIALCEQINKQNGHGRDTG